MVGVGCWVVGVGRWMVCSRWQVVGARQHVSGGWLAAGGELQVAGSCGHVAGGTRWVGYDVQNHNVCSYHNANHMYSAPTAMRVHNASPWLRQQCQALILAAWERV